MKRVANALLMRSLGWSNSDGIDTRGLELSPDVEARTAPSETPRFGTLGTGLGWKIALLVPLAAALGFAQGARVALGSSIVGPAPAPKALPVPPGSTGALHPDWRQGDLWLPASSVATRPMVGLEPQLWCAKGSTAQRGKPNTGPRAERLELAILR